MTRPLFDPELLGWLPQLSIPDLIRYLSSSSSLFASGESPSRLSWPAILGQLDQTECTSIHDLVFWWVHGYSSLSASRDFDRECYNTSVWLLNQCAEITIHNVAVLWLNTVTDIITHEFGCEWFVILTSIEVHRITSPYEGTHIHPFAIPTRSYWQVKHWTGT